MCLFLIFEFCHMEFANKHLADISFCYGSFHFFIFILLAADELFTGNILMQSFLPVLICVQSEKKRQGSVKTGAN